MNGLPQGWEFPTIEELLQPLEDGRLIHQGWSPQCERIPTFDEEEWGVLKTTAIQSGAFQPNEHKRLPATLQPRSMLEVHQGDLLLTCAGPRARCGIACLVRETRSRLMLSGKMYRFRVDDRLIDPRFVEAVLCGPDLQTSLDQIKTGGSDSGLNLTHERFRSLRIPLPPTEEQRRIVAAIDEAFSRLDAGEDSLRTVRHLLHQMRRTVLDAAVGGKLVQQDSDETPAIDLLSRAGTPCHSNDGLPHVPRNWVWSRVEDVGQVDLGRQRSPKYHSGDNMKPYLRVANVFEDRIDTSDVMEMHFEPDAFERSRLSIGDILLNEGQTPEFLGRPAMYRGDPPEVAFTNSLLRFRACEFIEPEWALLVFRHHMHAGRFARESRITTNIAHLSAARFKSVEFPVPPVEEQRRIVEEFARQSSFVKACDEAATLGLRRSAGLRRSILRAAFAGQLVPQDSTNEPASQILEQIKAARKAAPGGGAVRRKKAGMA